MIISIQNFRKRYCESVPQLLEQLSAHLAEQLQRSEGLTSKPEGGFVAGVELQTGCNLFHVSVCV